MLIGLLTAIATLAAADNSWMAAGILALLTIAIAAKYILDSASVVNCIVSGFNGIAIIDEKESKLNIVHRENVSEENKICDPLSKYPVEDGLESLKPTYKIKHD